MGRPPLELGTYGTIRFYNTDTGYRACTTARDYDGRTRAVERHGKTKAAAERALKAALRDRAGDHANGDITASSRVSTLAEAWYAALTDLSPVTMQAYRARLDRQILPRLGQLRVRELSVGNLDRHLRGITDQHGVATARMCRSVLSGMCTLAARHDALAQNPVRALGPVNSRAKKAPRALTVPQLRQLRAALTYDDRAIARDVPDLVAFLMATGLRIGEACGLAWDAVDLEVGTIHVRAAAVRVRGQGLVVKSTKTDAGHRTLVLPRWCTAMLRDRAERLHATGADSGSRPVFPAPLGGWRDPSNTQADLREAFATAGFDWVTSHAFRKTVATLMDQAGLSSRAAADQLGHANTSMTTDVYFGRKVATTGAAAVLEALSS
ncbi:site-specific integrase [Trujillonella endophytica]|uniref:Site-specific recombinase XerD n=1 Tax=Trujillonella endophytica TaxID=673521 RepID=A0A1H8QPW5_9ACTN|nr:site-specific integrase [Trujillella endophytica]SEO56242.1 Site-specific recombinase XerD [Trujillella endophytica]